MSPDLESAIRLFWVRFIAKIENTTIQLDESRYKNRVQGLKSHSSPLKGQTTQKYVIFLESKVEFYFIFGEKVTKVVWPFKGEQTVNLYLANYNRSTVS